MIREAGEEKGEVEGEMVMSPVCGLIMRPRGSPRLGLRPFGSSFGSLAQLFGEADVVRFLQRARKGRKGGRGVAAAKGKKLNVEVFRRAWRVKKTEREQTRDLRVFVCACCPFGQASGRLVAPL